MSWQFSKEKTIRIDLSYLIMIMDIMWPISQSHVHLLFIFIEINFYSLSFLCDVCNEVHEHMQ